MHGQCLNQSATCVKNVVVFYYIYAILHTDFNAFHVSRWPCSLCFCYKMYAEVALPEVLKQPHQPCSSKLY